MFLSKYSNGFYYIYYKTPSGKMTSKSTRTKIKSLANKILLKFMVDYREICDRDTIEINFRKMVLQFLMYSESVHSYNHTISLKGTFKRMLNFWGDIPVEQLDKIKVLNYFENRSRTISPHTLKREIECLSSLFNWAIDHNYLLVNLCKGIKRPRLPEKLPVFFSKWEFDELVLHTESEDLKDVFIFALNTGLRQMEIITLEWNQIDLDNRLLILHNRNHLTKSKRIRSLPLNKTVFEIIEKRMNASHKNNLIFTYLNEPINQQFISHKTKKLVKASGINPKLNFHSLRHTFASWLVQRGVPIYEVSKLLGHSDIRVTQIYSHLTPDNLRSAVDILN
jgi:site-specific recombinase XerD